MHCKKTGSLAIDLRKLLSQLCLDHGCAHSPPVMAAMEAVMKNNSLESVIHHLLDDFPDQFKQNNPTISASTLWDEDGDDQPWLGEM